MKRIFKVEVYKVEKDGELTKTEYKDYDEIFANDIDKPSTDDYFLIKIIGNKKIYMAYREKGIEFKYGDTVKWIKFNNSKRWDEDEVCVHDCALVKGKLIVTGEVSYNNYDKGLFKGFKKERYREGFIAEL